MVNVQHMVRSVFISLIEFVEVLEDEYETLITRDHIGKAIIKSIQVLPNS